MALSTKPARLVSPNLAPADDGEPPETATWRHALKTAIRDPAELCRVLELPDALVPTARKAAEMFGLFAPHGYVARIRKGDVDDPLLRQILPLGDELLEVAGFTADPVDDDAAQLVPGLLQKYQSRVLLITTGACAIHCRYCFRRHFSYSEAPHSLVQWQPALDAIAADPTIDEVILSGGDPLTLVDGVLEPLIRRLEAIPHLRRLRVHTRLPIVIPERVCESLLAWFSLTGTRLTPVCVLHANHAAELDEAVAAACVRLRHAGVLLLNQAVLLRGVNDSVDALDALSRRLLDLGVTPYYLHQLDRVAAAAHFEVPEDEGLRLVEALQTGLPGYGMPRYVREIAGKRSKTPLHF
ncbi:MAG: EF-P beta-lysylation protein EpmB [Planctomycetales bacterium]|nr:EF-P beta-lysylation protein EpmB [Planctomycetales bacterium]MBN8625672.1 EF-P beta-lysylation protein EpmB [Planctomycetota bacterium]